MGQEISTEPSSPQELYQWSLNVHTRGNVKAVRKLLERTSEKVLGGGLLALQIVGRIDSAYQNDETIAYPDEEDDAQPAVRFEVPGAGRRRPVSAKLQATTTAERHQFEVPTAIRYLGLLLSKCPHLECKLSFLNLAQTVAVVIPQSAGQRAENQRAFAALTQAAIQGALACKDMRIEDLVQVCDSIRLYSGIPAFREAFLSSNACENLLLKMAASRRTAENLASVVVFGSFRSVLWHELPNPDHARESLERIQPQETLCTSLEAFQVDSTALVEQMALVTLLLKINPTWATSLEAVAPYCEHYLSGKHGWDINDAATLMLVQVLCFLVSLHPAPLAGLDPLKVIRTCRRVVVKHGLHAHIVVYAVVILEAALKIVLASPDRGEPSCDTTVLLCLDTLGSTLSRLVAVVDTEDDVLSCTLGKTCAMVQWFTAEQRHRALLMCHACSHLLGGHILTGPDLPDWILVPAIETLASLQGSESLAVELASVVGPHALRFDVNKITPLFCRFLSAAKHDIMPRITVVRAVFQALLKLVEVEANATVYFKSMTVAELWVWRTLPAHFLKLAERAEELRRFKQGLSPDSEAVLDVSCSFNQSHADRLGAVLTEWEARMVRLRQNLGIQLPRDVQWGGKTFPKAADDLSAYAAEASEYAGKVHDRMSEYPDIGGHFAKYADRAVKLQKWYKKKYAVVQLSKTTAEYQKQTRACTRIQSVWRGRVARRVHSDIIAREIFRRNAAVKLQSAWRSHVKNWVRNRDMLINFICEKMGVPKKQSASRDRMVKLPKLRRCVVQLKEWNYYSTVMPNGDKERHYSLVLFYSGCTPKNIFPIFERVAMLFKETTDLTLACIDGTQNPRLTKDLRIPGSWPEKPLSLREPIMVYMAITIQRNWRGIKVKRAYKSLIQKIRDYTERQRTSGMHEACMLGDRAKMYHLLSTGYDPNKLCLEGELPLNLCLKHGQKECFGDLMKAGADVNAADINGHTPVFFAVTSTQHEVLRMLAKNGADVTRVDKYRRNLLHFACEAGQESTALLLLNMSSHRKLAFQADINSYTPLDYALSTGMEEVGMEMLRLGVPINSSIESGFIFHSMLKGMESITKLIIQHGMSDLNQHDGTPEEWYPLHYAASLGQISVLKKMIQAGANLTVRNAHYQTALHVSAKRGHSLCVSLLFNTMKVPAVELLHMDPIPEEGEVNCQDLGPYVDDGGNTVLHYACTQLSLAPFAEKLIKLVADAEGLPLKNHSGNTPLHYAASEGIYFVSLQLARRWAALDLVDFLNGNGNTALHLAMGNGHKEVVQMLIEVGADMDILDPQGNSLLHLAVSCVSMDPNQQLIAIQYLLQSYHHPVNVSDNMGRTPLHLAASFGLFPIVQELVQKENSEKGMRRMFLNKQDREGNTPLHYACQRSKMETDKSSPNYPYNNPMILFLVVEGADPLIANGEGVLPSKLVVNENVIRRATAMRKEKLQEEAVSKLL